MNIQLIIFDLDGVLVSTKLIHYNALNRALQEIHSGAVISYSEHLNHFDGLSTNKKLDKLIEENRLPKNLKQPIFDLKQKYTFEELNSISNNSLLIVTIAQLKKDGYKLYVASNAIRKTVELILYKLGISSYIDFLISNEDVANTKPHPEMYLRCFIQAGVAPDEAIILEDSLAGKTAAIRSGAYLLDISDPSEVTYSNIITRTNFSKKVVPYTDTNLNVLVPMAGQGKRFQDAGYSFPKPIIDVNGKPMIQQVVESLNIQANYIYIVLQEHYDKYNLRHLLSLITPNCKIVLVNSVTEGAACTVLLAQKYIDNDMQLLIVNSDQFITWNNRILYEWSIAAVDGGILTFTSTHPKWSFVKVNNNGDVVEVAEKKPISNIATVGIYYWKHGKDFVKYAKQMIHKNIRVNNEFYICPVFNEALLDNKKIKAHFVEKMCGLGTPEDLERFLQAHNA